MDYSKISDYFKYPAKVSELRQRLYKILADKNVDVSANESLNSLIEKVKSIESVLEDKTIYITENNTEVGYDVTEYTKAIVNVQEEAKENELDKLIDSTIEEFTMPSRINEIGEYKFYKCVNLSQVSIGNGTNIPKYAFKDCLNLQSIVMTNCINVGNYAFDGDINLSQAVVPNALNIGYAAFNNTKLTEFSNSQVYKLAGSAFNNNICLSKISLPNLTYLFQGANFNNCNNLTELNFPNLIRAGADFNGVFEISSISLPRLSNLEGTAFSTNDKLSTVELPCLIDLVTPNQYDYSSNKVAFINNCNNISVLSLPNLSSLYGRLAANCENLSEINIGVNVIDLPNYTTTNAIFDTLPALTRINLSMLSHVPDAYYSYTLRTALIYNCPNVSEINLSRLTNTYSTTSISRVISGTKISSLYMPAIMYIANYFAAYNSQLKEINMANLVSLGYYALNNNPELSVLNVPTVNDIGSYAVVNQPNLSTIELGTARIADNAFVSCLKLSSVYLNTFSTQGLSTTAFDITGIKVRNSEGNLGQIYVHSKMLSLFRSNYPDLASYFADAPISYASDKVYAYQYYNSGLISWPEELSNAKIIYNYAFYNNQSLTGVLSLSQVEHLGVAAFYGCSEISELDLPNCKFIAGDNYAYSAFGGCFMNCTGLTRVSLPNLEILGGRTFYNNTSLTTAYLPKCKYIGPYAFNDCSKLSSVTLDAVEWLGPSAFFNTSCISLLNLPNCEYIASDAFYIWTNVGNDTLSYVSAPKVSYVGNGAFMSRCNLTTVYLPECITIGQRAFWGDTMLSDLTIDKAIYILHSAFGFCRSLSKLSNLNIKYISDSAFYACNNLSFIYLPECKELGSEAFAACGQLSSIYLPKIGSIGAYCFYDTLLSELNISQNTYIGSFAFAYCSVLSSAQIDCLSTIPAGLFAEDSSLTNVTISVAEIIEDSAFRDCTKLENLVTSNIKSIGSWAFAGCNKLSNFDFPNCSYIGEGAFAWISTNSNFTTFSNSLVTQLFGYTFSNTCNLSIIDVPNVSKIGVSEFFNCSALESLNLNYSLVMNIPANAFYNCSNLSTLSNYSLFSGVSWVGDAAFYNCKCAQGVVGQDKISYIGSSTYYNTAVSTVSAARVTTVGSNAFGNCSSLTNVSLPKASWIGNYAFENCINLSEIYLPKVTTIGAAAFRSTKIETLPPLYEERASSVAYSVFNYCSKLKNINLQSCRNINECAFRSCFELSIASLPKCQTLSYLAFHDCHSLEQLYCPEVVSLGNNVFQNCFNLSSIYMPEITVIPFMTFNNCSNLSIVSLPETRTIGQSAFANCGVVDLYLPSLTWAGPEAFESCISLQTVNLPIITWIASSVFNGCYTLRTLSLPKCGYIAVSAFANCSQLSSLNLAGVYEIERNCFRNCINLEVVSLTNSSITIAASAFQNCVRLEQVNIPQLKTINACTFYNCSTLSTLGNMFLTHIGNLGLGKCAALKSLTCTSSQAFSDYACAGCNSLESVYILDYSLERSIGWGDFSSIFDRTPMVTDSYLGYYGTIYIPSKALANTRNYYWRYSSRFEALPEEIESKYILANRFYNNSAVTLTDINMSATRILNRAFYMASIVTAPLSMEFSNCTHIESYAFCSCQNFTNNLIINNVATIEPFAFYRVSTLTKVHARNCKYIASAAFAHCNALTQIYMPNLEYIGSQAFGWTLISEVNNSTLPNVNFIGEYAFSCCSKIEEVSLSRVRTVSQGAFTDCSGLTSVNLPECIEIGYSTFNSAALNYVNLPKLTNTQPYDVIKLSSVVDYLNLGGSNINGWFFVGGVASRRYGQIIFSQAEDLNNLQFTDCTISELSLPKVTGLYVGLAFSGCSLETLKLPATSVITRSVFASASIKNIVFNNLTTMNYSSIFRNNTVLERIVLDQSCVCQMFSCDYLFSNTPIAVSSYLGHFGSIYVRQSLITAWKRTAYWSAYSARMVAIEDHEAELRDLGLIDWNY